MTLRIAQSAKQERPRRWRWRVWMEGNPDELDQVDRVVWLLHPSFRDPMRESTDRSSGFQLEAIGWGEFKLRARVDFHDGKQRFLEHELELEEDGQRAPRKQPVVFISHAVADTQAVRDLSALLERSHVTTLHAGDILKAGRSWEEQFLHAVSGADAVVAVISGMTSPWVSREVAAAHRMGIPVLPVRIDSGAEPLQGFESKQVIDVPTLASSAGQLSESVHDLFAKRRF
jgi:hypothetical protein